MLFHSYNKLVRLTQIVMVQAARESKLESTSASQVSTYVTFAIVSLAKVNCMAKCRANVRRYYPGDMGRCEQIRTTMYLWRLERRSLAHPGEYRSGSSEERTLKQNHPSRTLQNG